jgi:hypothetical protein
MIPLFFGWLRAFTVLTGAPVTARVSPQFVCSPLESTCQTYHTGSKQVLRSDKWRYFVSSIPKREYSCLFFFQCVINLWVVHHISINALSQLQEHLIKNTSPVSDLESIF